MNVHTPETDIVAYVGENPVACFTDDKAYSEFYEKVKAEVTAHTPDVSTEKGRSEIKSLAYKVVRSKTAIDAAGKKLNEEARRQIGIVDAQRRKIREELDALADEVRRPVTEWEDAEKARARKIEMALDELHAVIRGPAPAGASAECIADRIAEVEADTYDPKVFGDRLIEVENVRAQALAALRSAFDRQRQHEADQAELARLRAEQEERDAKEQARLQEEADRKAEAERQERQAEEAKRRQEEADRRAAEAAEQAREEERRRAQEAIDQANRAKQAAIDEAKRREREQQEAAERTRREEEARAADREHRSKIMAAAKTALMAQGAGEGTAKKIVLAIIAGEIPSVSLKF